VKLELKVGNWKLESGNRKLETGIESWNWKLKLETEIGN
jgi:hypothetical protein